MRRTLFVVPRDLAPVIDAACTKALAPVERRRLVGWLRDQGVAAHPDAWLDDVCERTLAALADLESAAAAELTERVPELATRLSFGEGKRWAGSVGVSTRVLFLLAASAAIVRARPRGGWTSGQYRWARTERWLGAPLAATPTDEARASLLTRWLHAFGPATTTDVRWWTGWTASVAKRALATVGAVEVDVEDSGAGWLLPDDLDEVPAPSPWVALLPPLDATPMGWKERDWFLGPHADRLFDRNGNAGPTVWLDGRVVGGWGVAPGGDVRVELLEPVPRRVTTRITREAANLRDWLDGARPIPRFRTPLERELSSP
jgi:hypothetical protein